MRSTREVLDHHLKCFETTVGGGPDGQEGNLEGILSDYAPTAVLFTPEGTLKGHDAIKPLFQSFIAEFSKPGAVLAMKHVLVDGDYVYILWSAETSDNVYEMATDTFVVQDGKIVAQSFAGKISPKG